ncbi:PREDICTED: AN1-type zinc finger protein 2A-like isoform X1 [Amphimedon queenslandica]|uniref:AN1-type domain-containing protein n=1 Tax=Amphimedon queenslandica TaxID=400682 RepID=A0A1X7UE24_AMPQE|nr:PREDICTED: AN1-type zinc finger protein 2A-like isoform X1 [Amphimedon queenslandica]|eukprot:XP_011405425.1 PREDICTED: AN1-type zinc finger protein 2A-like isoform X1 [Amphimedon queenslandica]
MELPHIGRHCNVKTCSKLDFLPFECDCCHKIFCIDHKKYEDHGCTESYIKDVRVPVCPLCSVPLVLRKGEDPNVIVDEHIMKDCTEKKNKLYTNRCSYIGCKKKELVPVNCSKCRQNFCLRHRLEADHNCRGVVSGTSHKGGSTRSKPVINTGSTGSTSKPQQSLMSRIGADLDRERRERVKESTRNVSEKEQLVQDEALARALSEDLNKTQDTEDEQLAMAIQQSLKDTRTTNKTTNDNNNCVLS